MDDTSWVSRVPQSSNPDIWRARSGPKASSSRVFIAMAGVSGCLTLSPAARRAHLLREPFPGEPRAARCRRVHAFPEAVPGEEAPFGKEPTFSSCVKATSSNIDLALSKLLKFAPSS